MSMGTVRKKNRHWQRGRTKHLVNDLKTPCSNVTTHWTNTERCRGCGAYRNPRLSQNRSLQPPCCGALSEAASLGCNLSSQRRSARRCSPPSILPSIHALIHPPPQPNHSIPRASQEVGDYDDDDDDDDGSPINRAYMSACKRMSPPCVDPPTRGDEKEPTRGWKCSGSAAPASAPWTKRSSARSGYWTTPRSPAAFRYRAPSASRIVHRVLFWFFLFCKQAHGPGGEIVHILPLTGCTYARFAPFTITAVAIFLETEDVPVVSLVYTLLWFTTDDALVSPLMQYAASIWNVW